LRGFQGFLKSASPLVALLLPKTASGLVALD